MAHDWLKQMQAERLAASWHGVEAPGEVVREALAATMRQACAAVERATSEIMSVAFWPKVGDRIEFAPGTFGTIVGVRGGCIDVVQDAAVRTISTTVCVQSAPRCECGVDAAGVGGLHSEWCPRAG